MKIKIGLIQTKMAEDVEENLSKAISYIEKASEKGVWIVCLPENAFNDRGVPA